MTTAAGAPTNGTIVVGVDGSPSSRAALEWAARQAERTGDRLQVITTWEWPANYGFAVPVAADFDPAAVASAVLDRAVEEARRAHPSIALASTVLEGVAARMLVEASEGADLLVVGSRGHGELAGLLVGSVSERCVARARCPVVVVKAP